MILTVCCHLSGENPYCACNTYMCLKSSLKSVLWMSASYTPRYLHGGGVVVIYFHFLNPDSYVSTEILSSMYLLSSENAEIESLSIFSLFLENISSREKSSGVSASFVISSSSESLVFSNRVSMLSLIQPVGLFGSYLMSCLFCYFQKFIYFLIIDAGFIFFC